jgi:hypothetical protein
LWEVEWAMEALLKGVFYDLSHYCVQIVSYTHFRNMFNTMLLMGHAKMAMCDHHPQSAIIIGLYKAPCSTYSN